MNAAIKVRPTLSMVTVMALLSFSACGGGGPSQTTYTVGGSVVGLLGTGLVLENNGGDKLSVNANGAFTFATPIASGGAYDITVHTQPSGPAQSCRVTNPSGTVTSNVTGVGVRCADNPTSGLYLFESTGLYSLNLSIINSTAGALSSPVLAAVLADGSGNYPSIAIAPSQQYLYALYTTGTGISGFTIGGPGLQLQTLDDSPFSSQFFNGAMLSMALDPTGKFLYAVRSPARIEEFSVDAVSGELTFGSAVTETASLGVAVTDPAGKFLFAPDGNGQIFAYAINQSNGSLSTVAGSPFTVPAGGQPNFAVIDSKGKFIYATLSSGGVAAFALNSSTGELTNVPGSPFFPGKKSFPIATDPVGRFIYACNSDGSIDGFEIDASDGGLTEVAGFPLSLASYVGSIVVDPSGKFVYASSYTDSKIYGFGLDPSTGMLSTLSGSPFPSVLNPTGLFAFSIQ